MKRERAIRAQRHGCQRRLMMMMMMMMSRRETTLWLFLFISVNKITFMIDPQVRSQRESQPVTHFSKKNNSNKLLLRIIKMFLSLLSWSLTRSLSLSLSLDGTGFVLILLLDWGLGIFYK